MDCVDANIKKAGNTVERLAYPASGTKAFIKLEGYSLSYGAQLKNSCEPADVNSYHCPGTGLCAQHDMCMGHLGRYMSARPLMPLTMCPSSGEHLGEEARARAKYISAINKRGGVSGNTFSEGYYKVIIGERMGV